MTVAVSWILLSSVVIGGLSLLVGKGSDGQDVFRARRARELAESSHEHAREAELARWHTGKGALTSGVTRVSSSCTLLRQTPKVGAEPAKPERGRGLCFALQIGAIPNNRATRVRSIARRMPAASHAFW